MIVPFAPGGPTDVIARVIAQKLTETWGQQVVVDNRGGAGGNIGMGLAAQRAADGYTILIVSSSFVVNPSLYAKIPYDPYKSFSPGHQRGRVAERVLRASFGAGEIACRSSIALAKSNPRKYSIATPGVGTTPDLGAELLKLTTQARCRARALRRRRAGGRGGGRQPGADRLPRRCRRRRRTSTAGGCARWRSRLRNAHRRCPTCRRWPKPASKARRPTRCRACCCRRERRKRSSRRSTRDIVRAARAARREGAVAALGFDIVASSAGPVRRADQDRDREVGQGHPAAGSRLELTEAQASARSLDEGAWSNR